MIQAILKMLSASDDVSINRVLGALITINFVGIQWVTLFVDIKMDRIEIVFDSSIYLIAILLGLKGIEKIIGYFKK